MSKDQSEPAFPVPGSEYGGTGTCFGMSMRDYFAAKALQGLASNPAFIDSVDTRAVQYTADAAYQLADMMLSVRA